MTATNLFGAAGFDAFVSGFPGVTLVDQWESRVAKVGDKVFALIALNEGEGRITVKCSEESFEILTALDGIDQAPYFAKRKWVSIADGSPLKPEEIEHYVKRSYDLVAAGLTKKTRTELGIVPLT